MTRVDAIVVSEELALLLGSDCDENLGFLVLSQLDSGEANTARCGMNEDSLVTSQCQPVDMLFGFLTWPSLKLAMSNKE